MYSLNNLEYCVNELENFLNTLDILGIEFIESSESLLPNQKDKEDNKVVTSEDSNEKTIGKRKRKKELEVDKLSEERELYVFLILYKCI